MSSNDLSNKKEVKANIISSKNIYNFIKSKYILQKIINNLNTKKSLKLIKYNKKIRNLLEIGLNNYRECSETQTTIELEILPKKDKYGKFININEREVSHYHIYFDECKEEKKRNNLSSDDKIQKIKIIVDYKVISFKGIFEIV